MAMTSTVEEYLEAIYKLQRKEHPVRISRLAGALGVAPATVTEMTKRLDADGLVNRSEGIGVCLTANGRDAALAIVRKHRLVERFLTDVLGLPWDKVHEEACLYEHVVSPDVEASLEKLLDGPATCPHGFPIPDKDGRVVEPDSQPLAELPAGSRVRIVAVDEDDASMLSYLASLGLMPGVELGVLEVAPFSGPLLVQVKGARYALGREVAAKVHVSGIEAARGSSARARGRTARRRRSGGKTA